MRDKVLLVTSVVALTVSIHGGLEPGDLTRSEASEADIVAVVHVVLDVVSSAARACVGSSRGATLGRLALSGSVVDVVTRARATALEGVVKTNPVADL